MYETKSFYVRQSRSHIFLSLSHWLIYLSSLFKFSCAYFVHNDFIYIVANFRILCPIFFSYHLLWHFASRVQNKRINSQQQKEMRDSEHCAHTQTRIKWPLTGDLNTFFLKWYFDHHHWELTLTSRLCFINRAKLLIGSIDLSSWCGCWCSLYWRHFWLFS